MTASTQMASKAQAAAAALQYDGGLTCAMHVKDMARAQQWYQEVLGFQLQYSMEEMGWCELASSVANVNIGLSQVEDPKVTGVTLTFGVKDIDNARGRLEQQGVRFDGETREIPGMVKLATFFDPDGNSLMLYENLGE